MLRRSFDMTLSLFVMLLSLGGCSETHATIAQDPVLLACDPLATIELPITLGTVIAVGQDAAGTIYVIDQVGSTYRVFQSNAGILQRARVLGSGNGTNTDGSVFSSHSYASPIDGVLVRLATSDSAGVVRMAYAPVDVPRGDFLAVLAVGEELTVVDPSVLAGFELRNLPGDVLVEYNAITDNNDRIVVLRPSVDAAYEDYRVFYGTGTALSERVVSSVIRFKDGGTTELQFNIEGAQAKALFPASITGTPPPATLTRQDGVFPLTELAPTESLDGLTFTCLAPVAT